MSAITPKKPMIVGPIAGVRNDVDAEHMRTADRDSGTDLVEGINLDVTDAARLRERSGFVKRASGTDMHSLWSNDDGSITLVVDGAQLKRFNSDTSLTTLGAGLSVSFRMYYAEHAGVVYLSNGVQTAVLEDGLLRSWGVARPARFALAESTGSLYAGRYAVAASYVDDEGRESGLSETSTIDISANGGISVVVTPSANTNVSRVRLYVTPADGSELFFATDIPNAASTYVIAQARQSNPATTQFYDKPKAGILLASYRGRIYSAIGNRVNFTGPLSLELMRSTDYIGFESRVVMIAPAVSGMYVSDEIATYWVGGNNPEEMVINKVSEAAFENTLAYGNSSQIGGLEGDTEIPMWLSSKGLTIGLPGGQVVVPNNRFTPNQPANGAAIVRNQSDAYQYLASDGDLQ